MHVEILRAFSDNLMYLLHSGGSAAVVDPADAGPVLAAVERHGVRLETVLVTHHHRDHTAGCLELKRRTACRVVGPGGSGIPGLDETVHGGDTVAVGDARIEVMDLPGHTLDHVGYLDRADGLLWPGDALFVCGCGRVIEGTPAQMWQSLLAIRALPAETRVYCGHEYTVENLEFTHDLEPGNVEVAARLDAARRKVAAGDPTVPSTLAVERQVNPFLRADTDDVARAVGLAGHAPDEVFAEVRRRKDKW